MYYKVILLLKKIVFEKKNVSEIMFGWCLFFDAVYRLRRLQRVPIICVYHKTGNIMYTSCKPKFYYTKCEGCLH